VHRWVENPYWQHFCGETYFQRTVPCHPTSMTRWRGRIGEEGGEWLLTQTLGAARGSGPLQDKDCRRVIVDTTVQEKAVAFPTDSKLLDDARRQLVPLAEAHGLELRQNYNRVAKRLRRKVAGYAHARQYRRMRRELGKLRTRVGRVIRDVERQLVRCPAFVQETFTTPLAQARQILDQRPKDKGKASSTACTPRKWSASARVKRTSATSSG
jgi:IS5 family transposase